MVGLTLSEIHKDLESKIIKKNMYQGQTEMKKSEHYIMTLRKKAVNKSLLNVNTSKCKFYLYKHSQAKKNPENRYRYKIRYRYPFKGTVSHDF